jgi:hypothetical protein
MSAGLILDFSSSSSVVMPLVCSVVVVTTVRVTTWCDSDWLVSAISQLVCKKTQRAMLKKQWTERKSEKIHLRKKT